MEGGLPRVAIIADDLTGALDAAAPFATRGLTIVVATGSAHADLALAERPDVIAVSTNGREYGVSAAVAEIVGVAEKLHDVPMLFKKVDSRLKGHVKAELTALARVRGLPSVRLCPAIPELGRIVRGGRLSGFGVDTPLDCTRLFEGADPPILLADAATEADLDRMLAQALAEGGQLLAGARGLAGALARHVSRAPAAETGLRLDPPLAIAVGSRDPITIEQVKRLRLARPEIPVVPAPDGLCSGPAPDAPVVVLQTSPGAGAEHSDVQEAFATSFVPAFSDGRRTLVLTGGATAAAVLDRLGIGVLRLRGEAAPGIPVSRAVGRDPALDVVTKSGGFGSERALLDLVEFAEAHAL